MVTVADDVLIGMAIYLPEDKTRFRYTGPVQMGEFLKRHTGLSVVREYFTFNSSGYSEELEQAVTNLSGSEVLYFHGFEMEFNRIATQKTLSSFPRDFDCLDKGELEVLASAFAREVAL